ncbi:HEAT repeat domain-containing protein [Streptomyces albiaxialis]|uniref:HEAT repeat domain-containing protein n=1 Tax=Streptomyces albiaxialis TaxID=329523 RepID=A0ABN2WYQ0_9ACTN
MTVTGQGTRAERALRGLEDERASVRLSAALAVGSAPDGRYVEVLVERCAVEPEFFVRDMLTWALTRHPVSLTLPALLREVRSERTQARSQALHTLSKLGDRRAWPALTPELLCDAEDEVARSAWRAAAVLVPDGEETALATVLATQLGRGGQETQRSLSRALVALGEPIEPVLHAVMTTKTPPPPPDSGPGSDAGSGSGPGPGPNPAPGSGVGPGPGSGPGSGSGADPDSGPCLGAPAYAGAYAHALATRRLLRDPDIGFAFAIEEAKRVVALGGSGRGED